MKDLEDLKEGKNPSQKLSPGDARTNTIKRHKLKKMLKEEMNLLKDSTDESKVRSYYEKLINFYTILAFEAIPTNLQELEILTHFEKHKPPEIQPPQQVNMPINSRKDSLRSLPSQGPFKNQCLE